MIEHVRWLAGLIFSMSTLLLSGQYQPGILKLEYSNSSGEKGFTSYIYNNSHNPYKAVWELEDGSRHSVNYHEFDKNDNLLRKSRVFSDSIRTKQSFRYDTANRLVFESFSRSDGVQGEVDYYYSEAGLSYADCKGLNGWFYGIIRYNYTAAGEMISAGLTKDGKNIGNITYKYDNKGRLISEYWAFDSGFDQTLEYAYKERCTTYRSSNVFIKPSCTYLLAEENYDFSGGGASPSYFEYDENNRLVKKTYIRSEDFKTITTFSYEDNGLLSQSVRKYSDGKEGKFTYIYDSNENLIARDFTRSDGFTGSEEYNYDSHGMLISANYDKFDTWLSGNLVFYHDRYDRIKYADFRGNNGLNARLEFTYDDAWNLVRIFWRFSDNSTQTYWFKYKEIN